ncbi:tellurite resistance TerB family protein [Rubellimicrobium aerolatum]|uniref:Tellurite resistance TerB family protein n=1 Tax=Rubellimicrobium aerolatum TaxID=490979 RepID=A0ABW0SHI1_9RHOB|nr:tellurite resistance TerB family protein [Rubellimicrobium aerolatum]MBP1807462.1 tellurite resistance protein [Rubellimicrobium aerolatum]
MPETTILSPQDSLVAIMLAVSVADGNVRTAELLQISNLIENLPAFADYDGAKLQAMGPMMLRLMNDDDGLDRLFELVRRFLPERLWETAYALACDVAAADGRISGPEADMLEAVREELSLDRLHAAAIERGARARYQRV